MSFNSLTRATMRAYGDVQRVGYRFMVQDLARKLGVKGYVKNLPDGSVEIVAEAYKEIVEEFVKALKISEPPIHVKRLDLVYGEATGEYEYFHLITGDLPEEIVEGFGTGLKYINLSREETKKGFEKLEKAIKFTRKDLKVSIKDGHRDLKGSITNMHTDLKDSITSMHKDLKGSITNMHTDLKDSITSMHKDLKGSITNMHTDLKDSITSMHKDLKGSITTMNKEMKSSIDSMHVDMNRNFEEMAKRYDAISSELIRSREELTRAVDNMSRLIDEFIRRGKSRG